MTFWTNERLEQAAADELTRHGGSREDLSKLREYFRKRAVEKYEMPLIPTDETAQTSDVSPPD